jgi:hypothetical protein
MVDIELFYCSYKILFLDVLFPLSLDKVIFVDADQVNSNGIISNNTNLFF